MFSMAHRLAEPSDDDTDIARLRQLDGSWTVTAMSLAWALGFWMATQARWWIHPWFIAKFFVVLALSGWHGSLAAALRRRQEQPQLPSPAWHRRATALLLTCLVLIAIMVIVKPSIVGFQRG